MKRWRERGQGGQGEAQVARGGRHRCHGPEWVPGLSRERRERRGEKEVKVTLCLLASPCEPSVVGCGGVVAGRLCKRIAVREVGIRIPRKAQARREGAVRGKGANSEPTRGKAPAAGERPAAMGQAGIAGT